MMRESPYTRDFLLVQGDEAETPPAAVLRWHGWLGGAPTCWHSSVLRCRLWGPPPATATLREPDGTERRLACVLAGAPTGAGTLSPIVLQRRLLEEYRTAGLTALSRLDGAFCGVLIDERVGAFVFTDRLGFRKAFVRRGDKTSYATSRAVILGRGLGLAPDAAGVACCTLLGNTIGRRTLFASCDAVMPASAIEVCSGREERYWHIDRFLAERPRDAAATNELRERFNSACRSLIMAQPCAAMNLTGGLDTRAILSAALLTGRPLAAITSGTAEGPTIQSVVNAVGGVRHHFIRPRAGVLPDGARVFALLTDGEWDATLGDEMVDYWQRASSVAADGCLHGGVGEVWRSYYYKPLWPSDAAIARDPLTYLVHRLIRPRARVAGLLRADLRRDLVDLVRREAATIWAMVSGADGRFAAIDGFYLLERQRGLTRIASAADLWNPAHAPFAHTAFLPAALGYLGPQNRGDTLHRALIAGNSPALARLARYGGDSCAPLSPAARRRLLVKDTTRHLIGRAVGATIRRCLQDADGADSRAHRLDFAALAACNAYDIDALRRAWTGRADLHGPGNIAAVSHMLTTPGQAAGRFFAGGEVAAGRPA